MVTSRIALAGAWLALAVLTAGACVQLDEAMNGRDLDCGDVQEDICSKLASDIVGEWNRADAAKDGAIVRVLVQPTDCASAFLRRDPTMERCWVVEARTATDQGPGGIYYEHVDGGLVSPFGGGDEN